MGTKTDIDKNVPTCVLSAEIFLTINTGYNYLRPAQVLVLHQFFIGLTTCFQDSIILAAPWYCSNLLTTQRKHTVVHLDIHQCLTKE